ncbi:WD repeat-containing protein 54-like [Homarus americanus]|uniref:WD repeat-containing protein 54-like n=1 Tax=Homarus americanus TaxID=6706 RepID=UPI001C47A72D|nr:WD repeat-containing protein 54-like [Homarus americanus]XP_042217121.1 WD repeat-containing protein 54-like [Homarus americanus]XP_042217122.1 WD repeat-containing protein 54-like [Homarus americanus]XP_042217124.1 WD repeat-containing protein 54-like [Homarus americanus]XP_042217125.1 WD repeat-containing protein 54-like [Homarus americanus]XP_042217126.1 WD repeat-containing protein 54-like [Homarus americanus]XP_042217127.1 WD repeat-containing protein 54-like [Homarus americanus]XP_0
MYEREKTVLLKSSASLLPNNVCRVRMGGKMCAGVIHKEELNIVCPAVPEAEPRVVAAKVAPSATAGAVILQAAWVEVREQVFLVLATTQGALIFDWDGSVLLHAHLLPLTPLDTPFTFTKGIAALYTGYICVGVHTGEILVISVNEDGDMATVEKVRWHARPITALATHGQVLVSADDAGDMTIAQEDDGFTKLCSIDSYGSAVTCLTTWGGQVLAGYLSGHIRIFNLQDGYIVAEVCAHVRSITGLDVARETGMLMTASEDTFVRVWQLNPDTNLPIEHKYSVSEENTALCGGVFTDDLGSGYVVTGYDRRELICYAM